MKKLLSWKTVTIVLAILLCFVTKQWYEAVGMTNFRVEQMLTERVSRLLVEKDGLKDWENEQEWTEGWEEVYLQEQQFGITWAISDEKVFADAARWWDLMEKVSALDWDDERRPEVVEKFIDMDIGFVSIPHKNQFGIIIGSEDEYNELCELLSDITEEDVKQRKLHMYL